MIGTVYQVQPEPIDEARTRWVLGGGLAFGSEFRSIDPEALRRTYGGDPEALAEIERSAPPGGYTDAGFSLHVMDARRQHEYLRFDLFQDDPHYHYVWPSGDHNNVVPFDRAANGDMFQWVSWCLRNQLGAMLREANAESLADLAHEEAAQAAVEEVLELIAAGEAQSGPPAPAPDEAGREVGDG